MAENGVSSTSNRNRTFDGDLTDPASYTEEMKHSLVDKARFYQKLNEYYKTKSNKVPFAREQLKKLLEELQIAKGKRFRKDRREYFILSTYDTAVCDGKLQVIRKNDQLPLIALEDLYDVIFEYHIKTKHGGKTKLENAYRIGKVNIPRPATEVFLICCKICYSKRSAPKKVQIEKPKFVKGFSHKGQIDIVDFHTIPDKCYNVILSYQDYYTKFLILKPLENDNPETISKEILSIFMMFGPPTVLESYNGKYFVTKILNNIKSSWPITTIAHGEPKDESTSCKTPEEIEALIKQWMDSNYSKNWVTGLNFVQWQENTRHNYILSRCPYQALFGFQPQPELCTHPGNPDFSPDLNSPLDISEFPDCTPGQNGVYQENISALSSDEDIKPIITISEEDISIGPIELENGCISKDCDVDDECSSIKRFKLEIEECSSD